MGDRRTAIALAAGCLAAYVAFGYGGIRSPDNEITFRVAESLLDGDGFTVARPLEAWPGFGTAVGVDGREYSVFSPLPSLWMLPFVAAGRIFAATDLVQEGRWRAPPSFYVPDGVLGFVADRDTGHHAAHAVRFVASLANAVAATLLVIVLWSVGRLIFAAPVVALATALLFGLGSLLVPYATTTFSEPLALLLVMLAFRTLVAADPELHAGGTDASPGQPRSAGSAGSATPTASLATGLLLGLATTTHVSMILFAPFFAVLAIAPSWRRGDRRAVTRDATAFVAGLAAVLAVLAAWNFARFGSPWQTGRTVDLARHTEFAYGVWVAPWRGLHGLTIGLGKGLLVFSPAVIGGLIAWGTLQRRSRLLGWTLAAAVTVRLVFIASRSDWHGGFSTGPRLLLAAVPFLLLPVGLWLDRAVAGARWRRVAVWLVFAWACVTEQLWLALGEVFSYSHQLKFVLQSQGVDAFVDDAIYLRWETSPLGLLRWKRGPWLLRGLSLDDAAILTIGVLVVVLGCLLLFRAARSQSGRADGLPDALASTVPPASTET